MSGQHSELLVCFVVREVLLVETSQHHIASVLAKSSQITWWCSRDKKANLRLRLQIQLIRLRESINALEQADCSDVWRRNKSRQYFQLLSETMLTPRKSTLTTSRCVRLKVPCRPAPGHSLSERGEPTSSNHIEVCATRMSNLLLEKRICDEMNPLLTLSFQRVKSTT